MDATRFRVGALVEWLLAVACVVVLLASGAWLMRQVRTMSTMTPVIARETPTPATAAPAAIPPGAISLPLLVFADGKEVRVGETLSSVVERIGRGVGIPAVERAPNGERVTRAYEYGGRLFQLVFEPFARDEEPRLVAIYR
jgi:hypothetical protein